MGRIGGQYKNQSVYACKAGYLLIPRMDALRAITVLLSSSMPARPSNQTSGVNTTRTS